MNLRYCPFCGSHNIEFADRIYAYRIMCVDCKSFGPEELTKKDAAKTWNQRVNEKTLEE